MMRASSGRFEVRIACLLLAVFPSFFLVSGVDLQAQDRPAIARPKKTSKKASPAKAAQSGKTSTASQSSAAAKKSQTKADGTAEVAKGPNIDIGKILPEGRSLKGVKLPKYTGDRLSSLMTAITMKRLDDKHLDMEELRIIMYAKPGETDTLISTERGIYDLEKKEITSDTRTRIEQEGRFDLEGDQMVFDAVTQKGKMTGRVKMLLYKMEGNMMPQKKSDEAVNDEEKGSEKREGNA
ncbi:MAG: hypothetical protein QM496_12285 [Verrucomicrobiota bacterium]